MAVPHLQPALLPLTHTTAQRQRHCLHLQSYLGGRECVHSCQKQINRIYTSDTKTNSVSHLSYWKTRFQVFIAGTQEVAADCSKCRKTLSTGVTWAVKVMSCLSKRDATWITGRSVETYNNSCTLIRKKWKRLSRRGRRRNSVFKDGKRRHLCNRREFRRCLPKDLLMLVEIKLINMLWTLAQGKVLDLCYTIFHISFKARKVQDKTTKVIWCKGKWEIKHWNSSAQHQISCWTFCSYLFLGYHQELSHKTPWQKPHFEKGLESVTWN